MDSSNPNIKGYAITIPELGKLIGANEQRIRVYIRDGMPVASRGDKGMPHVLSSQDCIEWFIQRRLNAKPVGRPKLNGADDSNIDQRSQITALRMRKMEMELAEKRGDLVHAEDWSLLVEECMIALRTTGAEMPKDFRNEFNDQPQIARMARWLNSWVSNWLNTFSQNMHRVPEED